MNVFLNVFWTRSFSSLTPIARSERTTSWNSKKAIMRTISRMRLISLQMRLLPMMLRFPLTGSVLTDLNNERADVQRLIIDRLSAFLSPGSNSSELTDSYNDEDKTQTSDTDASLPDSDSPSSAQHPVILYQHSGRLKPLNHWEDPTLFTAAFPILFPSGAGGHLEQREFKVFLPAFARWCMLHHSRRFATSRIHVPDLRRSPTSCRRLWKLAPRQTPALGVHG